MTPEDSVRIGAGDGRRISDLASIGVVRHAFLILGALRHGTWLKLPLRKLNIERVGLLHDDTSTAIYAWMASLNRGGNRAARGAGWFGRS
jgi:hypothetical protein